MRFHSLGYSCLVYWVLIGSISNLPLFADSVFSGNSWLRDNDNDWKSGTSQSSLSKLAEAARDGDVDAMRKLGMMSMKGQKVKKSAKIAIEWWEKAAQEGDVRSMMYLGDAYRQGAGVHTSHDKAMRYYSEAFEAMEDKEEGLQCLPELPIIERIKKLPLFATIDWWKKRCEHGDTQAMYYLGTLKENERGSVLTEDASREYLILAARKGHPKAKKKIEKAPKEEYQAYWDNDNHTFDEGQEVHAHFRSLMGTSYTDVYMYTIGKTSQGYKYGYFIEEVDGRQLEAYYIACMCDSGSENGENYDVYDFYLLLDEAPRVDVLASKMMVFKDKVKLLENAYLESLGGWWKTLKLQDIPSSKSSNLLKGAENYSNLSHVEECVQAISHAYATKETLGVRSMLEKHPRFYDGWKTDGNSLDEDSSDSRSASSSTDSPSPSSSADSFEQALVAGSYPDWFVNYARQHQADIKAHHSIRNKRRFGCCSFSEIIKEYMDVVSRLRDQLGGRIPSTGAVDTVISAGDSTYH